jgi:hypothetical protein
MVFQLRGVGYFEIQLYDLTAPGAKPYSRTTKIG